VAQGGGEFHTKTKKKTKGNPPQKKEEKDEFLGVLNERKKRFNGGGNDHENRGHHSVGGEGITGGGVKRSLTAFTLGEHCTTNGKRSKNST